MRIAPAIPGIENVARWRESDEIHLPAGPPAGPAFLPRRRPLDEVLHRPSLDERLTDLLQPRGVDPDLLHPARLRDARLAVAAAFERLSVHASGGNRETLRHAIVELDDAAGLEDEIQEALAALMRG